MNWAGSLPCNMTSDFTTVLARLLSDGPLRDRFHRDHDETIATLNVSAGDGDLLRRLDAEHLDAQARTLLDKRLAEVRRLHRWLSGRRKPI